jgi:TonB family protein
MSRNRLQKKCFIVSLGMHLLLVLVVVFGVAFAANQKKKEPVKYLSISLFREPAPRKANRPSQPRVEPHQARRLPERQPVRRPVQSPASKKQVPMRKATPPPKVKPKPKKTTPKKASTPKKSTKKTAPRSKPKPKSKPPKIPKISISSTVVNKSSSSSKTSRSTPRKTVKSVSVNPSAAKNLKSKLSATVRAVTFRPGSSSYSNYKEWVRQKYQGTWNSGRLPSQRYRHIVTVRVTVLRSGKVASARILKRSGQAPLDASVQSTLNVVKSIGRAFPSGVTESRQTFTVDFQMR